MVTGSHPRPPRTRGTTNNSGEFAKTNEEYYPIKNSLSSAMGTSLMCLV